MPVSRPNKRKHKKAVSAYREMERGLKTRIISLLMLVLTSSLGFWFFGFEPWALVAWVITTFIGGYAIFELDLFVSKAIVVLCAFVMEFLVLYGATGIFVLGSSINIMSVLFVILDIVLIYALSKL